MHIFLIVTYFPNGSRRERAFAFYRAAYAYAMAHGEEVETEMLEMPVLGEPEQPEVVYTLRWNDLSPDTDNVEAVYGTQREAQQAVGRHGRVQELRIDTSIDAAAAVQSIPVGVRRSMSDAPRTLSRTRQNREHRLRAVLRLVA